MKNGSLFGYFGKPSMLNPIDHAISWPNVKENNIDPISIKDLNNLRVDLVDEANYKSLYLSRIALEKGGFYPVFLNAANEIAVDAFLKNKIQYLDILEIVEKVIEDIGHCENKSLETISDICLLYTSPSPRDMRRSRMPSSA